MPNGKHYPREWEPLNGTLQRLKVPGGWLVRSSTVIIIANKETHMAEDMIMVKDSDHEWSLDVK